MPLHTEATGLMGTDFLERTGAEINFECGRMALAAIGEGPVANSVSQGKRAALTVFSEVQVECNPRPTGQEELLLHEKPLDVPRFETTTDCSMSWLVRATVAQQCRQIDTGGLEIDKGESLPSLVCVEPAFVSIEGSSSRPCSHTSRNGHTPDFTSKEIAQCFRNSGCSKSPTCSIGKLQR